MKLKREEIIRSQEADPLILFKQGIKSKETLEKYTRTLRQVLCKMLEEIFEGDFEQRVTSLVRHAREEPDWTRDLLLSLSRKLRQRTILPRDDPEYLNPVSFGGYFKPIRKLFDMNGVDMQWTRIYSTYPEQDNMSDSRGWTRAEIQQMLRFVSEPMDKSIILMYASSGIRAGGFDFCWKDLTPVYGTPDGLRVYENVDEDEKEKEKEKWIACAMLRVYSGTSDSYPAFITPEAYQAIQEYKQIWIQDVGREPRPDDPIFKQRGIFLKKASQTSITKRITKIILKAGLRIPERKNNRRFDVPMMNGFRRFWNKTCKESTSKESPLSSLIKKEFMMGHVGLVKLDRNYFKTHVLELAEEYLSAVPELTIDDNARLRETNRLKDITIQKMESDKDTRISDLEKIVAQLSNRITTKKRHKRN